MKFLGKILLLGIVAGIAYFFGLKHQHSPALPLVATTPEAPVVAMEKPIPAMAVTVRTFRPTSPLEQLVSALHAKISQYKASEVEDPDDETGRESRLKEMLALVTDANVAEIIHSLSAEEMNTPFGQGALHHWMQVDSVTASNWLAARPETTNDQTLTVANDWIQNRDGLTKYLEQLPDTPWKQSLLENVSSETAIKDPMAAIKLAQQMKPGDAQTNLLRAVACGWVSKDPNAALDWITSVTDPTLREQLTASAVQSYAVTDPAQAAIWLVQEVKSGELVKAAALNILNTWVITDPAAAADWAARFPEGDLKANAVQIVATRWQQTDPDAATAWIQSLSGAAATTAN
jgi:hypothetical protein